MQSGTCGYICLDLTWSMVQKIWASSCWKRRTRVRPVRAPDSSFLCKTPKSAMRRGSSLHERGRWSNIRLLPNKAKCEKKPHKKQLLTSWWFYNTRKWFCCFKYYCENLNSTSDLTNFQLTKCLCKLNLDSSVICREAVWNKKNEIKDLNTESCSLALCAAMQHSALKWTGPFNIWKDGKCISPLQVEQK